MDKYTVVIEKKGNRFYYKNGILHREVGPAYVPWKLKEEYTGLTDQELYKKVFTMHAKEGEFDSFASDGTPIVLRARPNYECYYLEGKEYCREQFSAIMLEKELPNSQIQEKRLKL